MDSPGTRADTGLVLDEDVDCFPGRAGDQIARVLEMLASMGTESPGLAWVIHPHGAMLLRGSTQLEVTRLPIAYASLAMDARPKRHDILGRALLLRARPLRCGWVLGTLVDASLDPLTVDKRIEKAATLLERAIVPPPRGGAAGQGGSGAEAFADLAW